MASSSPTESGQAAVEAALTLPLALFMILGALQLFLMMQGRIIAQYAVARATHIGSVKHGECTAMRHAAVAALLPSFSSFLGKTTPAGSRASKFVAAWRRYRDGNFKPAFNDGYNEPIAWIIREHPTRGELRPDEEDTFDLPERGVVLLEVRMIYFFPLRIPFANWVMSRILLAEFGLRQYRSANPFMPVRDDANWVASAGSRVDAQIGAELMRRNDRAHYVAPIDVSYVTRMMTPGRPDEFQNRSCPPAPAGL